jgi:predicted nicotinamide N-methyase
MASKEGAGGATPPACTAIVPFSLHNPAADMLRLSERRVSIGGRDYVLAQHWAADGRGGTELGFGASVYGGSIVLAHYLHTHARDFEGARVVELGAGLGLAAMVAAHAGARVVATDGDAGVVEYARENLAANGVAGVRVELLLWGDAAAAARVGGADVVVAADVVAAPYEQAFGGLVATLGHLLLGGQGLRGAGEGLSAVQLATAATPPPQHAADEGTSGGGGRTVRPPRFILAYQRRHHSEDGFFTRMAAAGWVCAQLPAAEVHPDFRAHFPPIALFEFTRRLPGEHIGSTGASRANEAGDGQ